MFRWCAYCQRLLSETEPFEVFEFTHGVCLACLGQKNWSSASLERVRELARFHRELIEMGRTGDLSLAPEALKRAKALGVRPLDFLVGMVQPALYEIGTRWEAGCMSITEEHLFSIFASRLIDLSYQGFPQGSYRQSLSPEFLMVNAPGNFHFLGLRILEQWLISEHRPVYTVYPGLPLLEIIELTASLKPRYLGVSIAVLDQAGFILELANELQRSPRVHAPQLLVGGAALRRKGWKTLDSRRVIECQELSMLKRVLETEAETKVGKRSA